MSTNTDKPSAGILLATSTIGTLALAAGLMGAHTKTTMRRDHAHPAVVAKVAKINATTPRPKATPSSRMPRRDMACLASAIWHEAGNQSKEGQIAVAEVVLARAKSGIYPRKPCSVVAQRSQFSFVVRGIIPAVPSDHVADMMDIARGVVDGSLHSRVRGAMWFHAAYVSPAWINARVRLGRIGAHVFYTERT